MSEILITGSAGQLGNEISGLSVNYPGHNFIFTDVKELNIANKPDIENFFNQRNIDFVVNCAAYTAVDLAEKEKELSQLAGLEAENLREQLINLEKIAKQRSGLQREQAMMLAKNLIYGLSSLSLMAAVGGFYVLKFGIKSGGILTMVGILAGVVYALFASGYWMLLVGAVLVTSPLWGMIVILGLK